MIEQIKEHIQKNLSDIKKGIALMQQIDVRFYNKYISFWQKGEKLHLLESQKHNLFWDVLTRLEFDQANANANANAKQEEKNDKKDIAKQFYPPKILALLDELAQVDKDLDTKKRELVKVPDHLPAPELCKEVDNLAMRKKKLNEIIDRFELTGVEETAPMEDTEREERLRKTEIANLKKKIARAEKSGNENRLQELRNELEVLRGGE